MRTKYNAPLFLALILICSAINVPVAKSQATHRDSIIKETQVLSGSQRRAEDAILKSDIILIGQITNIGPGAYRGGGTKAYYGTTVKVTQCLKGFVNSPVTVSLFMRYVEVNEKLPEKGTPFILFIERVPGSNVVLKIVPATDDNILKIKQLIAATQTSK